MVEVDNRLLLLSLPPLLSERLLELLDADEELGSTCELVEDTLDSVPLLIAADEDVAEPEAVLDDVTAMLPLDIADAEEPDTPETAVLGAVMLTDVAATDVCAAALLLPGLLLPPPVVTMLLLLLTDDAPRMPRLSALPVPLLVTLLS